MAVKLSLSIIIVNWNTTNFLLKCLESFFSNEPGFSFEVIVVDNNSDDDIGSVKDLYPKIRLIKNAYNYGFGVATNIGLRASSGEYVMTLNPDTVLYPETIENLVGVLDNDASVGIAVPVIRNTSVSKADFTFANLFFGSVVLRVLRGMLPVKDETRPFAVEFIGGTGYVCRRSALADGSMFSEDNFLFGEEYYLCREMHHKGFKIVVVPSAQFEHHASVTFKYDPERLAMATRLGSALGWRIRKERWGSFVGVLSGFYLSLENAAKWGVMILSKPFSKKRELQRLRTISQSRTITLGFWPLLMREDKYIAEVNNRAEVFFNGGGKPVHPPEFREI